MEDKEREIADLWNILNEYIERYGQTDKLRAYLALKEIGKTDGRKEK